MANNFSDNNIEILGSFPHKLLIEKNNGPMKIHLDGFETVQLLELIEIVENNGGQLASDPGKGIITLSPVGYIPEAKDIRFNVEWLYKSVSLNAVQKLLKYRLKPHTFIELEADAVAKKGKYTPGLEGIKEKQQSDGVAFFLMKSATLTGSASRPEVETKCSKNKTDSLCNDEEPPSMRPQRKSSEYTDKNSIYEYCTSSHAKCSRSLNGQRYTADEEKDMINFLIEKNAISRAGGYKIWEKMVKEKKSKRTVESLRGHFKKFLKYKIEEYIEDERVLAEFRQREEKLGN